MLPARAPYHGTPGATFNEVQGRRIRVVCGARWGQPGKHGFRPPEILLRQHHTRGSGPTLPRVDTGDEFAT